MTLVLSRIFRPVFRYTQKAISKIRFLLVSLIVIGLGVLLGYLSSMSQASAELVVSIIVIISLLLIIMNKPLNGLLILIIFLPFAEEYIEIPLGAGVPDLSFSRFIIAFLFVFVLAQAAIGKFRFATPVSLAEICIVATTVGLLSVAPISTSPDQTLRTIITRHFSPLVMYFFARHLVKDKKDLHRLLIAIVIFGLASSVYAIYEASTGHILFIGKEKDASQLQTTYGDGELYLIRGLLGRAGNFGRVLIVSIPVSFYLFFENRSAGRKLLLVFALVVQFYAMFLTYNRTSWYALMVALLVMQFFYPQFRKLYLVMLVVGAIVLWFSWDQVNQSDVVENRVNYKTENFNGRGTTWETGFNMWKTKPIRGGGYGWFTGASGAFRPDGQRDNLQAIENDYLDILVHAGLIAFVPYALFLLAPLVTSVYLFFRSRAPDWSGFIQPETISVYWAVIIAFLITSYTQSQNQVMAKILPFALAGAIVGTHQHWVLRSRARKQTSLQESPDSYQHGPPVREVEG